MPYSAPAASWTTPQAVDWSLVRSALVGYLREIVDTFTQRNPDKIIYGIVVVSGQNWELSVYLNSEEGYASMPQRFRAQCVNWPPKTDEELLAGLGRWYFEAWEFALYEFKCRPEVDALNNLHCEVLELLSTSQLGQGEEANLSEHFVRASAGAVAILEKSAEIQTLRRTCDFKVRLFDANRYEWDTDDVMKQAREELGSGA